MTEKYFSKGIIQQTETTLIPDEPTKMTCIIDTEHPTLDGILRGHYVTQLTTERKMILRPGAWVLCEISENEKGNHVIDHIYVDVED